MALNRTKVVQEAEKYVARGKVAAAIKEYRRLLAENPDDVTTLNRVGDLYVQNGESDEALRLFWEVAERYARDGFSTRAIAIFKKIIRTNPIRLDAYERLAELYAQERLIKEAIQQYQVLADYHQKRGDFAAAGKVLRKMVEVQPEDPALLLHLAEMLERVQVPTLLVTHDPDDAALLAQQVVHMADGRLQSPEASLAQDGLAGR